MKRLSTKVKRVKDIGSTCRMHRFWKGTSPGRQRMKSFVTEELARSWAVAQKLDEKMHELHALSPTKWQWRKRNPRLA
jgi:hypothetical protein